MKNVLIPHFSVKGKTSYPDDYKLFSNMKKVTFMGVDYWLCKYDGLKQLEVGPNDYEAYIAANTGIRIIGLRAFFERIPKASRKLIRKSNEEDVRDVMEGMRYLNYVDLDSPITTRDLNTLLAYGMITQDDIDTKLIIDGQVYEKYNGVL